jgi:hypothetical protein
MRTKDDDLPLRVGREGKTKCYTKAPGELRRRFVCLTKMEDDFPSDAKLLNADQEGNLRLPL